MLDTLPIFHVVFENLRQMGFTVLRFSEYYDSPKFTGLVFDHETFIESYAQENGKLTYGSDWSGHNFPGTVLAPFRLGTFNPLWKKEKIFLGLFHWVQGDFYIITTCETDPDIVAHEIVHGLYYLYPAYAEEVRACLAVHDMVKMYTFLLNAGYDTAVQEDEANAYLLTGLYGAMEEEDNPALREKLDHIFIKYFGYSIRGTAGRAYFISRIHRMEFPSF